MKVAHGVQILDFFSSTTEVLTCSPTDQSMLLSLTQISRGCFDVWISYYPAVYLLYDFFRNMAKKTDLVGAKKKVSLAIHSKQLKRLAYEMYLLVHCSNRVCG